MNSKFNFLEDLYMGEGRRGGDENSAVQSPITQHFLDYEHRDFSQKSRS